MTPATRALCVRGFGDQSTRLFRLMDRQITYDEKFLQFFLVDFLSHVGVRIQHDPCFQGVADHFFLARALNSLPDHAAESQKPLNLSARFVTPPLRFWKFLQMNRISIWRD